MLFGLTVVGLVGLPQVVLGRRSCNFPAIYNFGDSNSDTGGISAAFASLHPPNGETFFGHPSGRFCDGRLIIDFIGKWRVTESALCACVGLCFHIYIYIFYYFCAAEELKLPRLSAYLDSLGMNFRHGANFATGGSSILPGGYSPFDLWIQMSQFIQFKSRTSALYAQLTPDGQSLLFQKKG